MEDIFGERLKQLREKKAVPQKEVAEAIGITAQTIMAYESGRRKPPLDIAVKLAKYFGASLDWLCGIEDSSTLTNRKVLEVLEAISDHNDFAPGALKITIYSSKIIKYLSEKKKMEKLLEEGVIDKELFQLWEEKYNRESWLDEPFDRFDFSNSAATLNMMIDYQDPPGV